MRLLARARSDVRLPLHDGNLESMRRGKATKYVPPQMDNQLLLTMAGVARRTSRRWHDKARVLMDHGLSSGAA